MTRELDQQNVWPPILHEGETDLERRERLSAEAEAKRINDMIDRQIEQDRLRREKDIGGKILLLGQAESGKSTILKNFQIYFAPKAFEREAELWRPVIHLNLVRSINFVITFISSPRSTPVREGEPRRPSNSSLIGAELRRLCSRLAPLRQVEENLIALLSGHTAPSRRRSLSQIRDAEDPESEAGLKTTKLPQEIVFPSRGGWKQKFLPFRGSIESEQAETTSTDGQTKNFQLRKLVAASADDMMKLWGDSSVQSLLKSAEIRLDEQPGFFLDQISRITKENYVPRPEDVLKARVTTVGPEEHIIMAESARESNKKWTVFDVGGSQSQRAAWAQFFDDVNIIIFLAPMSGFNQVLAEDESVNRLTDSLRLWQTICSNKILADVEFVLFLNKLDILETKLKLGVEFSSFVTSYTGKNETKPVAKYLLDVFVSLHQQYSPKQRKVHPHLTCAVDMKATASVIYRIKEVILAKILTEATFM